MKLQLFPHEAATKNRSIQNEYYHPSYTYLSKTERPNQSELLYQRIQKMKRQLSNVSSELIRLDPENIAEQFYADPQKKGEARRPLFQLLQSEANQSECNKKLKIGQKTIKPFGNYTLNVPIEMVFDDQSHDEGVHGVTGEMMDRNFDRILDLNCGLDDDILEIQSKFAIVRSQKRLKQPQYEEPDHKQQHIYSNTHQRLLQQQNQYIRDQLVLFTSRLEADKSRVEEYKMRYRHLKKENHKMKAQLQYIRRQIIALQKLYEGRESQYNFLYERHQILLEQFDKIGKQYHCIQNRLQQIYKQNVMYQQRLQDYENHRDREIESLQQEKIKVKQALEEEIVEKQKQIQGLNQYISQIKIKNQSMEKEMARLFPERNSDDQIKLEQESKIFDEGANSICLSLAEAETLKNIIEQQQESHKSQIQNVRRQSMAIQNDLKLQIARLQAEIEQLTNKNYLLLRQKQKQKQLFYYTQSPSKNPQFSHSTESTEDWKGQISHELLRINFTKQIKRLQGYLLDQRQQKQRLMDRISKLQQHNILIQNEQDDQLQQLLQNCVNELEKQKQINNFLKSQNEYYKQRLYRQQMPVKGCENQILN